ncbi:MAG: TonB-dependent receptor [Flavobacteriaceae bacterium]|nr:TonB-dependent receptor [Flavobacteriaceae bacterium]
MNYFSKFLMGLTLLSTPVLAQQNKSLDSLVAPVKQLEEVVVSDSRFPFKRSQSGKPIIKIDSKTISSFQGLGLSALLKGYAGVEIIGSQTYAGQNKTVSLRGGRNRQVLILIDGVRVSDPSRIDNDFNLNFLSLDQIESIEILKGAASSLYGSSAATGVISIQTKKAAAGFNLNLQSSMGSDSDQDSKRGLNLFKNALQLSQGGENLKAKAYFSNHNTNGMSAVVGPEVDPFSHTNFGASLNFKSQSKFNFNTGFDRSHINSDYDNSFPLEDANFQLLTTMDRFHFNPNFDYKNGGASLKFVYQKVERDFKSDYPFQTEAENTQLELFNKYAFGTRFYTVVGALFQNNYAIYEGSQPTSQTDAFANVVAVFSNRSRINFGGRLNNHSTYGSNFTYSINPSYQLLKNSTNSFKILAALSTAYIAPSLYQLYDPYSGNSQLEPEENQSLEFGFVFNSSNWELSSTYFQRIENPSLIYDLSTYRYENANENTRYNGVETQISGSITGKLKVNQQLTFTQTENGDLRYLPKFSSQTQITYRFSSQWHSNMSLQAIGERFGLDNKTLLEGYQLLNLSVHYQLKKAPLGFFIHATNLFNANYIEIESYATRGRNVVGGFTFRLP